MMSSFRRFVSLAAAPVLISCTGQSAQVAPTTSANVITQVELMQHQYGTAYEAVQALHGNWLRVKGTDSFNSPTQLWVYVDEMKLGGVETLKTLDARGIKAIRFIDGITASGRWGFDHGQGVIQVATH